MFIKNLLALLYQSFIVETIELLRELKKPRTWFYLSIVLIAYAVYKSNLKLALIGVPLVIFFYLIRQHVDGKYKAWILRWAVDKNDIEYLSDKYAKYLTKCYYAKKPQLSFDEWKQTLNKEGEE